MVPAGRFGVYLGGSSALANLPLRGSFTVTPASGQAAWPGWAIALAG
jgi:hypothetical protein